MDTRDVLDELLAQYDDATEAPAGLDAEEAELIRRVMHLAPEMVEAGVDAKAGVRRGSRLVYPQ